MPTVMPPMATPGSVTVAEFVAVALDFTAPVVAMLPPTRDSRWRLALARTTVRPTARPPTVTLSVRAFTVRVPVAIAETPPDPTVPEGEAAALAVPERSTSVTTPPIAPAPPATLTPRPVTVMLSMVSALKLATGPVAPTATVPVSAMLSPDRLTTETVTPTPTAPTARPME